MFFFVIRRQWWKRKKRKTWNSISSVKCLGVLDKVPRANGYEVDKCDLFAWGDQTVQIYGEFRTFPKNSALFRLVTE